MCNSILYMKATQKTEIIDETSFCSAAREQLTSTARLFQDRMICRKGFGNWDHKGEFRLPIFQKSAQCQCSSIVMDLLLYSNPVIQNPDAQNIGIVATYRKVVTDLP
ncbi:hypothetical protein D5086_014448 [Populus alba]|uniref:Uncharacterized protein n=1 Tax=Populus alba TaxID=43335 RepID=A0ACC4BYZ3_POPAL